MTHDHNKKSNSIVFHTPHFGNEMIKRYISIKNNKQQIYIKILNPDSK